MSEDATPYRTKAPVVPPHRGIQLLTDADLTRARVHIAFNMLTAAVERLDVLPPAAQAHVAEALKQLALAVAVLEAK